MGFIKAIITYFSRNVGRVFDIGEKVMAIVEKLFLLLLELVPMTATKKDDIIVNKVHKGFKSLRGLFDKARDFFLKTGGN